MVHETVLRGICTLIACAAAVVAARHADAATFNVATGDVAGLISAVETANANGEADTINVAAGTYTVATRYPLTSAGLPPITSDVTIVGAGAGATVLERALAATDFALILVAPAAHLHLEGVTLQRGHPGISNLGRLDVVDCAITQSTLGVSNHADATVTGSVVTGSSLTAVSSGGTLEVRDSQITGNQQTGIGVTGILRVADSLVQGNVGGGVSAGTDFPITSAFVEIARSTIDGNGGPGVWLYNYYGTEGLAARLVVTDSTISNNAGSGIANYYSDEQEIVVRRSTISGNSSPDEGGGIRLDGASVAPGGLVAVTIASSTISGNQANGSGGAIYLTNGLRLGRRIRILRSTIADNVADADANGSGDGGGIVAPSAVIELQDSILAGNLDTGGEAPDCTGPLVSRGHNVVGVTTGCALAPSASDHVGPALLGPLAANGGPTATHLPLPGSPAIDAADPASCGAPDQRGLQRPVDGNGDTIAACDAGAVEAGATTTVTYLSDHFLCRDVKLESAALPTAAGVALADEIESKSFDVRKTGATCAPADVNAQGVADTNVHLHAREVKESPGEPHHVRQSGVRLATELGLFTVDTVKPDRLLVPASAGVGAPLPAPNPLAHDVDRFKCYKARLSSGSPALPRGATALGITLSDAFTDGTVFTLSKLQRVCDAADENGAGVENPGAWLACFQAREKPPTVTGTPTATIDGLFSTSEFGTEELATRRKYEVCIPAVRLP